MLIINVGKERIEKNVHFSSIVNVYHILNYISISYLQLKIQGHK
jgi:hypothetical protein